MIVNVRPGGVARRTVLRGLCAGIVGIAGIHRAAAENAAVTIDNFAFAPTPLMVPIGTRVTWTNHDDIPHSIVMLKQKVRSPTLDTDQTFSFTFADAGTFDYICGLHPHMQGMVVVDP